METVKECSKGHGPMLRRATKSGRLNGWRCRECAAAYTRRRYASDPDKHKKSRLANLSRARERELAIRIAMPKHYIATVTRLPVDQITPELLEAKREQLRLHRLLREAKRQLKGTKK